MINAEIHDMCQRIAAIETERRELAVEIGDIKTDAKEKGYDVALITRTVRLMLMTPKKRTEALVQHDLFDTYLCAAGLIEEPTPEPRTGVSVSLAGEGAAAASSSPADHSYDPMTVALDPGPMPDFLKRNGAKVAA